MVKAFVVGLNNYRHYCVEDILSSDLFQDRQQRIICKLPSHVSYDLYRSVNSILNSDLFQDRQEASILSLF
jgi:hypothetical protein